LTSHWGQCRSLVTGSRLLECGSVALLRALRGVRREGCDGRIGVVRMGLSAQGSEVWLR
jgi:hypothetical protein